MLAFFAIFLSGLCGYLQLSILSWLIAAVSLFSISLAEHQLILRRAVDRGRSDVAYDTLMRSCIHALVATGGCYWLGRIVRLISGL
jgi:hypothetical protein